MGQGHRNTRSMAVVICLAVLLLVDIVLAAVLAVQDGTKKNPSGKEEDIVEETGGDNRDFGNTWDISGEGAGENTSAEEPPDSSADDRVEKLLAGMDLKQKVAQMFMVTPEALTGYSKVTAAGEVTKQCFIRYPVGGVIYMAGNLIDTEQTRIMLSNMQDYSVEYLGFPVFLGVDEEGGTVARIAGNRAFGVEDVGNISEIGAAGNCDLAYQAGSTIGAYLSALGFNLDFAPVADVWSNNKNTVVKYRSPGSDPELVRDMVIAQIEGFKEQGILCAVKHFPGHGSTSEDSHNGAAVVERTLQELFECDLIPFKGAVQAGVPFVMVGHLSLPKVVEDDVPAVFSKEIITDILRGELGFDGIVITDALDMGAVTDYYSSAQAAVMAVAAGADMLLMPEDFVAAYEGVLNAVQRGELTQERIDESVRRILKVKLEMADMP
ncbi:MAG: glycoside hydrolase family 3 protein [Lachnospiraceae bacterium]|nr:glycoside hydrolase family 3 protein [Lachnospiraceae bacterium]